MLKDYEEDMMLDEEEMTEDEMREEIRENEDSLLDRLLAAADYAKNETMTLEIRRPDMNASEDPDDPGKVKMITFFKFDVHALSEDELTQIRKKYTKYTKNRRTGGQRTVEEVDLVKFRSSVIYNSTVEADQERIWNNKTLWDGLRKQGHHIVNALDVIEAILLPGEKDKIMDALDKLGGYDEDNQIIEAKN